MQESPSTVHGFEPEKSDSQENESSWTFLWLDVQAQCAIIRWTSGLDRIVINHLSHDCRHNSKQKRYDILCTVQLNKLKLSGVDIVFLSDLLFFCYDCLVCYLNLLRYYAYFGVIYFDAQLNFCEVMCRRFTACNHWFLGPPSEGRGGTYSHEHCFFVVTLI